jgi:predicted nucleotidyltransferase
MLQRHDLLPALVEALRSQDSVLAVWEGGSAAFNRIDEWSDIDLQAVVRDDAVDTAFTAIEHTLMSLSPIDLVYTVPQPSWHGHAQKFYRLRDTSPFLLIDIAVIKENSTSSRFLEPEIHGNARMYFDRADIVRTSPVLDRQAFAHRLWKRVNDMRTTFALFQPVVLKEIYRGYAIDALSFYQNITLAPLVELLRMVYMPFHYNFRGRYLYHELPQDVVARLEKLHFITDLDDLRRKQQEAEEWFHQTIITISLDSILESVRQ